jgi:diadenylate cyclase
VGSIFNAIYATWNQIIYAVSNYRIIFDTLDILIIAFIIFKAIDFLRDTRAGQLVKGIVILFVIYIVSSAWELATLQWMLSKVMDSAIIAIAVIFQPELRKILENVGRTKFSHDRLFDNKSTVSESIDKIGKAAGFMSEKKIGALIVFERQTQLGDIISTGTVLDATASVSIVNNIFFPKSPLHDGAMIVRDGRLYAAGCILPLTQNDTLNSSLGTRHRAAIGMSENSDAVVLVVSEETGIISIAVGGKIKRNYNSVTAIAELQSLLLTEEDTQKSNTLVAAIKNINPFGKNKERKDD